MNDRTTLLVGPTG